MKRVGFICLMAAVLAAACERSDEKEPVAECEQLHQALAACSGEKLGPAATQPPPVVPSTEQEREELRALCAASAGRVRQACR